MFVQFFYILLRTFLAGENAPSVPIKQNLGALIVTSAVIIVEFSTKYGYVVVVFLEFACYLKKNVVYLH
jgi:hypothetical protein